MAGIADFNSWLEELNCPQSLTSPQITEILFKGVLGLIWEDIPQSIRPVQEVSEVRKNIILYKLINEPRDSSIQSVKNTVQLKEERKKLDIKIKNAQERWKKQEFVCRQKANLLEKRKEEKVTYQLKKNILKIKTDQMQEQMKDCAKMQKICQNFMPPVIDEIPQSLIFDCLSLVSNYSNGPGKRKIWSKISEVLCPVKISVLWDALLAARSHYTDLLMRIDAKEDLHANPNNKSEVEVGIANICSEHLDSVGKSLIYNRRTSNNQMMTMEYVEKIEKIIEKNRPDLIEWIPLTLEVKKLDIFMAELKKELEKIEENLPAANLVIDDNLGELIANIKTVDNKIVDYIQDFQNALGLLKSSSSIISRSKESLSSEVGKLQLLRINKENTWNDIDLIAELNVFHSLDINALRKIILKSDVGTYKHLQTCLNKASTQIDLVNRLDAVSNFPMMRVPVFYLMDFYKTFIANITLNKRLDEGDLKINDDYLELLSDPPIIADRLHQGLYELLQLVNMSCQRTQSHNNEFDVILKNWSNQSVREVVSKVFGKQVVNGATLEEWEKRFSMIFYILKKSNINIV